MSVFAFTINVVCTTFTDGFMACNCAHIVGVVPTAFAFFTIAGFSGYSKFITYFHFCFRHQQSKTQFFAQSVQIVGNFFRSRNFGFSLQ